MIAENASGLLFKNKRDRKIINVDPKVELCSQLNFIEAKTVVYKKNMEDVTKTT